jgi:DNA-binding NtrC family response regulator
MADTAAVDLTDAPRIWIVEDEPEAAALAVELCESAGADPSVFSAPTPFLDALRSGPAPEAVVLDWRLERELSAALFLATRHQYPQMPVVYWTGSAAGMLPAMIREDEHAVVVDKAAGAVAFEQALAWALRESPSG